MLSDGNLSGIMGATWVDTRNLWKTARCTTNKNMVSCASINNQNNANIPHSQLHPLMALYFQTELTTE
jgi:hypothetical protein